MKPNKTAEQALAVTLDALRYREGVLQRELEATKNRLDEVQQLRRQAEAEADRIAVDEAKQKLTKAEWLAQFTNEQVQSLDAHMGSKL